MNFSDQDDIPKKIEEHLERLHEGRRGSFEFIRDEMDSLNRPIQILETGCVRDLKNYSGDGCSTLFWDLLCEELGGKFMSIDNDGETCAQAQQAVQHGEIWKSDSMVALANPTIRKFAQKCDLLYLDSMDWTEENGSALFHLQEIRLIYTSLPLGCLIAVDDCHSPTAGKHVDVAKFLEDKKCDVVKSGYVTIWRK